MVSFANGNGFVRRPDDDGGPVPKKLGELGFNERVIALLGYPPKGRIADWLKNTCTEILRSSNHEELISKKTDKGNFNQIIEGYEKLSPPYPYEREALLALRDFKATTDHGIPLQDPKIQDFLRRFEKAVRTGENQQDLF